MLIFEYCFLPCIVSLKNNQMENKEPTYGNGKICHLEIPALDIDASVSFYREVFGWSIRYSGDGSISFDDAVGEVSGM